MNTDAQATVVQPLQRESIVDLGRADVVETERSRGRKRQGIGLPGNRQRGKAGAAREELEEEATQMVEIASCRERV